MSRLNRLKEARKEIERAALKRWRERAPERERTKEIVAAQGPGAADSIERQDLFAKRVIDINMLGRIAKANLPLGMERRMGMSLDLVGLAPSDQARRAGRPVARIVSTVDPKVEPEGFATGFLVAPDLLMTNWHVFPDRHDAVGCGANFLYEETDRGVQRGLVFELDPSRFYVSEKSLDFAIVAVAPRSLAGDALADLGQITLIEARPKILKGQPINIIQHPEGRPKQYAFAQNRLVDILEAEGFLQYETDTLEGSSGAPAFSELWELVALHHAAIPMMRDGKVLARNGEFWTEEMGDDAVHWIANEGTRISAITSRLQSLSAASDSEAAILASLIASTADPVPQAFAALGGHGAVAEALPGRIEMTTTPPIVGAGRSNMDAINFTFTGPVTINITGSPAAAGPVASTVARELAVEKSIRFDPDYEGRQGYDPSFLSEDGSILVPTPKVGGARLGEMLKAEDGSILVLKYHHFELAMNKARRLQMWSAVNVDYAPSRKVRGEREDWGSDRWIADPRIPANVQIFDADFYKPAGNIDRGHIVRREDNEWGDTRQEIEFANSDTFHWTNCTPQHEAFNQTNPARNDRKTYGGLNIVGAWGAFEDHIQRSRKGDDTKVCIIAGPILAADDPSADFGKGPVQYPLRFFKIVCVVEVDDGGSELKAFGFILDQTKVVDRFGIERFGPGKFWSQQAPLTDIEAATGLVFDPVLHAADVKAGEQATDLASASEIRA